MNEKTIRMPKELLAKWLAALRSGEYKQGRRDLCDKHKTAFCCLGVLVEVSGEDALSKEHFGGLPSEAWQKRHGVSYIDPRDGDILQPYLPTLDDCAAAANDKGATFAEIADAIEACAEGV